ncbi:MAG: glycosyltransferase [Vicinamibacteraceae bacterium]
MTGPLDVVLLLTSFDVGGTERQMVELAKRLDPSRFRPHLACFHKRGRLVDEIPARIDVREFPVQGFANPAAVGQLIAFGRWCRTIGAAIVHTCDLYGNIFGLPGAALAGVPVRIGNRREILTGDKSRAQLTGQRLAYRLAHAVVANSSAACDQLEREGVPADKIRLIANGLDVQRFTPVPERPAIRRIVMVANLRAEKGHDTLLGAAPRILASYPDASFTFVGEGPRREALATLTRALGIGERVNFLGECRDVAPVLAEHDLFVLPSRSEAFPNALIEAMATALPVVATNVGGIPEVLRPGVNGRLVPPDDSAALADTVLALMADPAGAAALGRAARADVERHYTLDRMVERFEQLYLAEIETHVWNRGNRRHSRAAA